jgi:hypothetical protein
MNVFCFTGGKSRPATTAIMLLLLLLTSPLDAQQHTWRVDSQEVVDGNQLPYNGMQPGDTLLIRSGMRGRLLIQNLQGTREHPLIMMNDTGAVMIETTQSYGISIRACRYFRFTGTGDPSIPYGIQIKRVDQGAGMGIGSMSSDYEIDHISVENCPIAGIYAKTDPYCPDGATREKFTQYNTLIHDNYIAHVGNEGLYVGSSKYLGQHFTCDGKDTLLMPSVLEGVRIYNNVIMHSGWDGIQISSASKDCQVYGNTIRYDSEAGYAGQMSGILLGGGSRCDCFNNLIEDGKGDGIEIHGLGGSAVFNNIIVNPGRTFAPDDLSQMKHGIFVSDVSVLPDSSFYLIHNDIINPKSDGIRFMSSVSRHNLVSSNLIVNPGNYDYYENSNTSYSGNDAYIMLPDRNADVRTEHNFLTRYVQEALVSETDYSLLPGSPLVDAAGSTIPHVSFDFLNQPRPVGTANDIGAVEGASGLEIGRFREGLNAETPWISMLSGSVELHYHSDESVVDVLTVYDMKGEAVMTLVQESMLYGDRHFRIPEGRFSRGMYVFTLQKGQKRTGGKFFYVR